MTDPTGFRSEGSRQTPFSSLNFAVAQVLSGVRTATVVKVLNVSNHGDVSPVGTVDIQPMVQQLDAIGTLTDLPPVYGVPYMRMQGGTNAVILDPQIGDLGIALFGDRDLSLVAATKAKGAPGSARKHHLSDALYIGGILNGTPIQYVQFQESGITILSPFNVTTSAPTINEGGNVVTSDNVSVGNGASGSFSTPTGQTVMVQDGIITNIF